MIKNILSCMLTMGLIATFSSHALEKPATPEVDFEMYRIEKLRGENPDAKILRSRIDRLKNQAKQATGTILQRLNAAIAEYETALQNNTAR